MRTKNNTFSKVLVSSLREVRIKTVSCYVKIVQFAIMELTLIQSLSLHFKYFVMEITDPVTLST